ncbi:PAP2 superfamily-domain-containing protein [Radiomyces spectabilis]|uniref:PAP2 superfamily-domain-containing protein n=1 Tax=Radiomyces spectabilis TaxID=64574 RepID=UPI00222031D9|nr:PAP2 superfamily-domain-containing protein [Radiomyces spectabilis]KAI8384225.1 PAP2 superfamily-domain-containing protein [Radiomyces spectabilis]
MFIIFFSFSFFIRQTRILVSTCTFLTLGYVRSFHVAYFTIGAVFTAVLAKILKHIVRQPRPQGSNKRSKKSWSSAYGMPSSHSQAIAFFTVYIHLLITTSTAFTYPVVTWLCLGCAHTFAFAVIWSRVRLRHHTPAQVLVGTLLGISMAYIWFTLWDTKISRYQALIGDDVFIYALNTIRQIYHEQ